MQGFVTDHDKALEELFTENAEGSMNYNSCINTMATRIATVFASMKVPFHFMLFAKSLYPCTLGGRGWGVMNSGITENVILINEDKIWWLRACVWQV